MHSWEALSSRPRLHCVQPEGDALSGLPQRPEDQGSEGQRSKAWAHHHAKPEVVEDVARDEAAAIGTARELMIDPEGAAPHHAGSIIYSLQLYSSVMRIIWITKNRFVWL